MKNDLSKCNVGDFIWTISHGWEKVISVNLVKKYPVKTSSDSFRKDGVRLTGDKYPSAFTEPPAGFNAEPKPVTMVKKWKWAVGEPHRDRITELHYANFTSTRAVKLLWTEIEGEE